MDQKSEENDDQSGTELVEHSENEGYRVDQSADSEQELDDRHMSERRNSDADFASRCFPPEKTDPKCICREKNGPSERTVGPLDRRRIIKKVRPSRLEGEKIIGDPSARHQGKGIKSISGFHPRDERTENDLETEEGG